jgi:hypothetical protein
MEKQDGVLVWIAYSNTCAMPFDAAVCLEQAKRMLPQLKDNILEYARADAPWMSGESYVELGPVERPAPHRSVYGEPVEPWQKIQSAKIYPQGICEICG